MEYVLSHCSKNLLPIETMPSVAFRPTSPQGGLTGTLTPCYEEVQAKDTGYPEPPRNLFCCSES